MWSVSKRRFALTCERQQTAAQAIVQVARVIVQHPNPTHEFALISSHMINFHLVQYIADHTIHFHCVKCSFICCAQVADFLGTIHHEFTFTVQEGLDALEDLIWHIESFEQVRPHVTLQPQTAASAGRHYSIMSSAKFACGFSGSPLPVLQLGSWRLRGEQRWPSLVAAPAAARSGMCRHQSWVWHPAGWSVGVQVRSAVPMYILTRKIKAMGIKVVLSGEGADEALGGYLYFHKAPDAAEYHRRGPLRSPRQTRFVAATAASRGCNCSFQEYLTCQSSVGVTAINRFSVRHWAQPKALSSLAS